ncbi:MAG: HAD-IB family phosphatase [Candidatus Thermoplasmatota archaeon]|nr:HAD-IB family phosphatase [Candidatus Thermoplasmatota archaeon]
MAAYQLVAFDMDGVLVDMISSWHHVHTCLGTDNAATAEAYRNGDIDSQEFMDRDLALWRQQHTRNDIASLFRRIDYMPGIHDTMQQLSTAGVTTAIVSGGLDMLAERIAQDVGIDHVLANGISQDMQQGILRVPPKKKDKSLRGLARRLSIRRQNIVAVGNSKYDVAMFRVSGLGIAFNPCDTAVVTAADVTIKEKDLTRILEYILG